MTSPMQLVDADDHDTSFSEETPEPPKFVPSKEKATVFYWYLAGWPNDCKVEKYTAGIRIFYRMNGTNRADNLRYFYVPDTVKPGSFFVSETALAGCSGIYHYNPDMLQPGVVRVQSPDGIYYNAAGAKAAFIGWYNNGAPEKQLTVYWENGETGTIAKMYDPAVRDGDDSGLASVRRWHRILKIMERGERKPYDVKSRFWRPRLPSLTNAAMYSVWILPLIPEFRGDVAMLQIAEEACKKMGEAGLCFDIKIASTAKIASEGLIKVGHNFFRIFDTYMTRIEYKRMIDSSYRPDHNGAAFETDQDPWPLRPWPTPDHGVQVNQALGNAAQNAHEPVVEPLTAAKIAGVPTIRAQSQQQVMNNVSANITVAQTIWPNALVDQLRLFPYWNAEWLHRQAHSLGGKQEAVNLIFGTSECNTDMLRAEMGLRLFAENAPTTWDMTLRTTKRFSQVNGQVRMLDAFIGKPEPQNHNLDAFAWAAPYLEYEFIVGKKYCKAQGHWTIHFETMSRYVPLRLEIEMDELLWEAYLKWFIVKIQADWDKEVKGKK